jgi:multidrug efflux pump subunit AcrA (membrane-fusion protein)
MAGYWLPTTALVGGSRGLWFCYVLKKIEDRSSLSLPQTPAFMIEQSNVEVLHTESDRVFVRGTLQPGDQVVINGTHRLVPGQQVVPISSHSPINSN